MSKLLMINGDRSLAQGKKGAFYNTLEEFHKYWDRIDIICPSIPTISHKLSAMSFFGNVFVHPSPRSLIFQPFWILKKGQELYREQNFDLMTVHEYPPFYNGIGARLLWNKIQVPYVLEIHHVPGYPKVADSKEWFYRLATRFFIKHDASKAKSVRVVNQHQVPEFLIKAGVPEKKIILIPSFYIDLDIFRPTEVEKEYDLVFAARLEKNKGIFNLLEALKIAKNQKPDIKLLIVGYGSLKENLKLEIENFKLHNNVILTDWLPTAVDVARAFNSARVFINPSFNEGGPRVVLEAIACGLPIITTRVGAMVDIIKDGENGLYTNWDPHQMAEKFLFLLNNPELQKKFSQTGLELVKQFEKKSAIKNWAEKLQNIGKP